MQDLVVRVDSLSKLVIAIGISRARYEGATRRSFVE